MMAGLAFIFPAALFALAVLPVIWWLLRFVPPQATRVPFPPLRLLLQLKSKTQTPSTMPWWLLVLRLFLAAAVIGGVSGPYFKTATPLVADNGPILFILDDGWAAASDWPKRISLLQKLVGEAATSNQSAGLLRTTDRDGNSLNLVTAAELLKEIPVLRPKALATDRLSAIRKIGSSYKTVFWLADGRAAPGQFIEKMQNQFGPRFHILALNDKQAPMGLGQPALKGADLTVPVLRAPDAPTNTTLQARGKQGRILAEVPISFDQNATSTKATLSLPIELRNDIQSLALENQNQAAAHFLMDDRWRRKTVALASNAAQEGQPLLSTTHYLESALEPFATITHPGSFEDLKNSLDAGLSLLVLADVGKLPAPEHQAITDWINKGGLLLRFAGPRLSNADADLLPVTLRQGDRSMGSAMSWEKPQDIVSPPASSPLAGLQIDQDAKVSRQVLAEPDGDITAKTWASLSDGTPLITAAAKGKGLIILVHVTANADWSNIPLTGTFLNLIEKIVAMAPAAGSGAASSTGQNQRGAFSQTASLSGTGELLAPDSTLQALSQTQIEKANATPQTPAGFYTSGGTERAINVLAGSDQLAPLDPRLPVEKPDTTPVTDFTGMLFTLAAILFVLDCLASLALGGFLNRNRSALAALYLVLMPLALPDHAHADDTAMQAALQPRLAFVKTGNSDVDAVSLAGLKGLSLVLADRTSAQLAEPQPISIEADNLAFYPLLYWPVTADAPALLPATSDKLTTYMKNGGTILFDMNMPEASLSSDSAAKSDALKRLLDGLDVPPLEPVPQGHALTKSFYLLKDFPGRELGGPLWVESGTSISADNVSGIIIGYNDYASAWAMDANGAPLFAVSSGDPKQRETAYRVGVNIVMYTLTGNYKTDQVHVPALLERLGKP